MGTYDVASIKPSTEKTVSRAFTPPGGRLELGTVTLRDLIAWAYDLKCAYEDCNHYISGGAAWVYNLKFEIVAKPAQPDPPMDMPARRERAKIRVRPLIEDRFALRVRSVEQEMPVFALRVAKGGPKLTEETDVSGTSPVGLMSGPFWATGSNSPISALIPLLARIVGRPVVDRTGLKGTYHMQLMWDPGYEVPRKLFGEMDPPSIFTAVVEQLGLTLHAERGMVKTILIEHAEMPTPN